ncbi:hypothetical protein DY138_07550 [Apilactobacillus timberlakei]|nr:hypothetical protein DY138_07550 [Apilactobacillus timberlakei]TPR18606.1 hypothetical protein DY061_07460 [Apilactobacillus timberlakei]TPR20687.1 hypothetical protein DY083_07955 [Apilactobacillus timberlakei]TPR21315.1 hypothetical protein DY102_07655 [Apilactobacillus timberlakei]
MKSRVDLYSSKNKPKNYKLYIVIISVLLVFLIIYFGIKQYNSYLINKYSVRGVLVSQSDGYIDFVSLANNDQKFVYIKASQGSTYTDNNFSNNFNRSQGSGMQIGVYHVFSTQSKIKSQLLNFTRAVGPNYGSIPPMVFVNSTLNNLQKDQLSKFVYMIHRYYNTNLVINCNNDIFNYLHKKNPYTSLLSNNLNNSKATFVSIYDHSINLDGSNISLNQLAFNGKNTDWERYLLKSRNR